MMGLGHKKMYANYRQKQLQNAIDRVFDSVENPNPTERTLNESQKLEILTYDMEDLHIINKCTAILDAAIPDWKTSQLDIIDYIKDQAVNQMARHYTFSRLQEVHCMAEAQKRRARHVDHLSFMVKTLENVDSNWKNSIPGMVEKLKFDIKHGKALSMPLY